MAEDGVDDGGVRHGEDELLRADAGKHSTLDAQPVVCGRVQLDDRLQMDVVVGNGGQDALIARQARDELVEHGVADDKDVRAAEAGRNRLRPLTREGRQHRPGAPPQTAA